MPVARPEAALRTVDLPPDSPLLDTVYDELLRPGFPADELFRREQLRAVPARGRGVVTAVLDDVGIPLGTAVGEWSGDAGVLLLSYLAVRDELRSTGIGGRLMREVTDGWQRRFRPRVTLTEADHPLAHAPDSGPHGDPGRRLRFYHRHGGQALDVPYAQPALRPGARRRYGMVLIRLAPAGSAQQDRTVAAEPVRAFVEGYFGATEGPAAREDPVLRPMWRALDDPGGIRLLPLSDPAPLPLLTAHPPA